MIEKLLRLFTCFRFAAQASALGDRAIDQLGLWGLLENLIESFVGGLLVNLLQPKVPLQTLSSNRPLLHAQRCIGLGKPPVVEISVLAQTLYDRLDNLRCGAAPFQ